MNEPTLFDSPTLYEASASSRRVVNVRLTDPVTSRIAADVDRSTIRREVRACLLAHPEGLTDWEIVGILALPDGDKPSVGKRRQECGAVPVMVDGEPLTRPSPKGKPCLVWRLPYYIGGTTP